ncbi:M20/M25/M40 family metallo-hydrolase [Bacillus sp. RO2]|uniref:M20/M25/M40 family metallo-hydrolase n=1 Tax=Bacillus sp. RO2 TaxID=2723913 RepID=UPI00145F2241|nr:M20/M25/M40 family metallo-hydrolase [Bacillus sp. RO2]NMH74349.1 M20/M25/M40 family metallo-hydrolase [Bacillus sp. RO2]
MDWKSVKEEATLYLQRLIQFDTSNPSGNELPAAEYLALLANENGLLARVEETGTNRGNLIVSYNGTFHKPIILLSHLDVVPARKQDWSVDPFAGEIIDDVLWGRGTIDTKQLTIMHLMTLILLKRNGVVFPFDLVLVSTADEENGSELGLKALLPKYEGMFKNSYVLNEGGGFPITIRDHHYYLCETGQKGVCRIRLSFPKKIEQNAYFPVQEELKMASTIIKEIALLNLPGELPFTTKSLIETLTSSVQDVTKIKFLSHEEQLLLLKPYVSPFLYQLFRAMSETTFTVTKWNGGRKYKELQGDSEIFLDCRTIPGISKKEIESELERLIAGRDIKFEIQSFEEGYESTFESKLFEQMNIVLQGYIPNATIVPFLSVGSNDGRHVKHLQSKVYGFSPMLPDMTFERVLPMVHGVDERLPLESLKFGIQVLYGTLTGMEGSDLHENE